MASAEREKIILPSVCLLRGGIVSCATGHMCVQCGKASEWLYTRSVFRGCRECVDVWVCIVCASVGVSFMHVNM